MSVKKSFADPEPARTVPAGSSRHQIRHPKRFQPLPSPPSAMPLATPSRRPKLPPVPAVLKAREQATFGSAAVPAASAEPAPQPAPETTAEPGPETASKPEPLHADVPASVAVDMAPVPAADPEQVATEHRWGDRGAPPPPPFSHRGANWKSSCTSPTGTRSARCAATSVKTRCRRARNRLRPTLGRRRRTGSVEVYPAQCHRRLGRPTESGCRPGPLGAVLLPSIGG